MENPSNFSYENYQQKEMKLNGFICNILALVMMLVLASLFGFIFYQIWGTLGIQFGSTLNIQFIYYFVFNFLIFLSAFFAFLLANEFMTGMYWSKYTEVKIKVIMKSLFRFCYCKEPIKIKNYIIGLIIPIIFLGMIPLIMGMIYGNIFVLGFGIIFISNGAGAIMTMYLLRKEDKNNWIKDMDSTVGLIIFNPRN
jgi:hypothetical protein